MDKTRHWQIVGCSAYTGEGLLKGFDWLVQDIASRIYMLDWEWYMECVTIWQDKIFDKIPIVQAILHLLWELDHRCFNQRWWHTLRFLFFDICATNYGAIIMTFEQNGLSYILVFALAMIMKGWYCVWSSWNLFLKFIWMNLLAFILQNYV